MRNIIIVTVYTTHRWNVPSDFENVAIFYFVDIRLHHLLYLVGIKAGRINDFLFFFSPSNYFLF